MSYPKSKLALAVLACAGLAACGGSSGGGGGGGTSSGPDSQNWQTDFSNTDRYGVTVDNDLTIDPETLAINTNESASSETGGQFSTPADATVTPDGFHGAVSPNSGSPDDDPTNNSQSGGGPFWDGWTYRSDLLSTNLPNSAQPNGANFHPLEENIGSSGSNKAITPASTNPVDCNANVGNGNHTSLTDAGTHQVFGVTFPVCAVDGDDLDGDLRLSDDHLYVLDGTVQVGNGDEEGMNMADDGSRPSGLEQFTLEVDPGTQIFGASGSDPSLVITRGSEIDAVGTPDLPIIFGAVDFDANTPEITATPGNEGSAQNLDQRGAWGSIVLSGYGEVNAANDDNQLQTEAVPDNVTRWFGGTDNSDSSGTIEYAVVAETGEAFRQDEEVQGITIEGSGSGTTIRNIQVLNSKDDGIEWFGGAANARNVVIQAATDDSLDQDLGWQGTVKNALVIQGPNSGNRGMETDNNGDNFGATPKTRPVLANVTILGHSGNSTDQSAGALHREGYGGEVYRSVYADNRSSVAGGSGQFQEGCLDVDSEVDEDLEYGDVLFNCDAGALSDDDDT